MRVSRKGVEEAAGELMAERDRVRELEHRVRLLSSATDNLQAGIVVVDESGDVVFRNATALAFLHGRGSDALVEGVIEEFCRPNGNATRSRVLDLLGPPSRVVEIEATPILPGDRDNFAGWLITVNDITELRRIDKVRTDFVANVSHELKTPIGALSLLAETLIDEPDKAVRARLTEQMNIEADRAAGLIAALIDLSRIESTMPVLARVDLRTVIEMAVSWCHGTFQFASALLSKSSARTGKEFRPSATLARRRDRKSVV